jgi:hypothetical protein
MTLPAFIRTLLDGTGPPESIDSCTASHAGTQHMLSLQ